MRHFRGCFRARASKAMGRTMKRMLVVVFTLTALTGCATKPSTPTPTYLRGNWKIQITTAQGINLNTATIQAGLVPVQVPCTLAVSVNNVTPPTVLGPTCIGANGRSEEHTSELQSLRHLVCRLLLEK